MLKLLKKIWMFPFMVMMGIPDSDFDTETLAEIAGTESKPKTLGERIMSFAGNPDAQFMQIQDAAASEDEDSGADQDGNQGDEETDGLDTASDEDGSGADQDEEDEDADDSTSQETDESDEGTHKGTKKRTLEERAAEIAEKIVTEKLAERDKQTAEEKPDFIVIDQEKVDAHIAEVEAQIDELRLEGKYAEARKLSRKLDQLDADLEENEKRKQAYIERQKVRQSGTQGVEAARKELDEAAELYRSEMKIDQQTWDKMGKWFESQMSTNKLLVAEFNDVYARNGKVAAIRFAHDFAVKNMGQGIKKANEQKEKQKTKTSSLTTTTTGKVAPADLKKAQAAFAANPSDENFMKLQAAKRQARA